MNAEYPPAEETPSNRFILCINPELALICLHAGAPADHTLETAAVLTGIHPARLVHSCRLGLLGAKRAGQEPTFGNRALDEIRRIEQFRRHHGVGMGALARFGELGREVDRLQAEVPRVRAQSAPVAD